MNASQVGQLLQASVCLDESQSVKDLLDALTNKSRFRALEPEAFSNTILQLKSWPSYGNPEANKAMKDQIVNLCVRVSKHPGTWTQQDISNILNGLNELVTFLDGKDLCWALIEK